MALKLVQAQPDPQLYAFYGDAGVGKTRLVGQVPRIYGKTLYVNCLGGPESIIDREKLTADSILVDAEVEALLDVQKGITRDYLDKEGFRAVILDKYGAIVHQNVLAKLVGASDTRAVYGSNLSDGLRGLAHLQLLRRPIFLVLGETYTQNELGAMWWFPDLPGKFPSKFSEYVSVLARMTVKTDAKTGKSIHVVQLQRAGNNVMARTREPSGKVEAFYEAEDLVLENLLGAAGVKLPESLSSKKEESN